MTTTKADLLPRAISIPVVGPVGKTWDEFGEALREAWQDSTALANWTATTLYAHDVRRKPTDTKLAPMPNVYLYGLAGRRRGGYWGWPEWSGCYSAAQSLMRGVEKKYRKSRFDLIWRSSISLPNFRFPHPYPIHGKSWKARIEGGQQTLEFPLKGQRWTAILRQGPEFARQSTLFRQIVSGQYKQAEMAIYRVGFREKHTMVKLVAHLLRPEAKGGRTMNVYTDPNAFWVWDLDGTHTRVLNADHVQRWVIAHQCYLQRLSEDAKRERRWPAKTLRNIDKARALCCEKHENRIDTWCHEATAMLTGFAVRNGVGCVLYNDTIESYFPRFPWFELRNYLSYKLEAAGIEFIHSGSNEEVA